MASPARPARPVRSRPSPDALRDGLALVLLALSLTLPWNLVQVGGRRVEVVAAVVVSAASLALPRLHRRGRLPPDWTTQRVRVARALAALPYVVCVVITLVVDAVRGFADTQGHAGIGGSLALGLAGVLLAAGAGGGLVEAERLAPRRAVPAAVLGLLVAVLAALVVASTIIALAQEVPFGSASADARVVLVAAAVLVLAVPACGVLAAEPAWRAAAVAVGSASALAYLVGGWTPLGVLAPIESVHLAGFGLVLLAPLAAAVVVSAADGTEGYRRGGGDGRAPIGAAACTAAVSAAMWSVIALLRLDELAAGGRDIATVVLAVVALAQIVLALNARSQLRRHLAGLEHPDPLAGASAVAVASVVLAVVGLLVVAGDVAILVTQLDVFSVALPVAVVVLLLVPAGARSRVVAARASRYAPPPRPPGQAPGRPPVAVPLPAPLAPAPSPSVSFLPPPGLTPGQAADPSTSPALLAAMVEVAPELRPAVAANPAASGELIARLRSFGDPSVDAVLRARGLG